MLYRGEEAGRGHVQASLAQLTAPDVEHSAQRLLHRRLILLLLVQGILQRSLARFNEGLLCLKVEICDSTLSEILGGLGLVSDLFQTPS